MVDKAGDLAGGHNANEPRCGRADSSGTVNDPSRIQLFAATGAPKTQTLNIVPTGLIYHLPFSEQPPLSALSRLDQVLEKRPKILHYIHPLVHKEDGHA